MRGRQFKTTAADAALARSEGRVKRNFAAERLDALWVSDLTYVATWRGFVYVAFVIDASSARACRTRCVPTSRAMRWSRRSTSVLLELISVWFITATEARCNLSILYTERLKQAGLEPSVGSVEDSYDNALAESIIELYKTEVIRRRGPWRDL